MRGHPPMRSRWQKRRAGRWIGAALVAAALAAGGDDVRAASPWDAANEDTWRFPPSMKVVDVKEAFGAVGDGRHDDTDALKRAFDQRNAFVYLPNGTYLVRDRIQYTQGPSIGPTIQGESRDGVVIKLADDAPGFDDPKDPRAVVRLIRDGKVSADYFKIKLRNLTIDAGRHRGAIGLMFYANNNGQCRSVRIVGRGAIGLDLSYQLNGPLLVSNVEIDGFDVGIKGGSGPYNSQTLEHVVLRNQREWGVYNDGECLSIRGLRSTNTCPAVFTRGGSMVLIDSELVGGAANSAAVTCAGQLFVRDLKTAGYGRAIQRHAYDRRRGLGPAEGSPVPGGTVAEWTSHPPASAWREPGIKSLNLPVEEAPYVPLEKDFDRWVCVDDFGADGSDKQDDTAAVRKAFDHAVVTGKSVVSFAANGRYIVNGELVVRGPIARLQGANSYLTTGRGEALRIRVEDGPPPVVVFDLLDRPLGRIAITIENASSRTLVVNNFRGELVGSGPGKTFLEDACSNVWITHPKHRCWVRQLNSERRGARDGVNNHNQGGTLWVLSLKTEGQNLLVKTTGGGRTEVLGGWVYVLGKEVPTNPMFQIVDAKASFAGIAQWHYRGMTYPVLLDETQGGQHRQVTKESNGGRASFTLVTSK